MVTSQLQQKGAQWSELLLLGRLDFIFAALSMYAKSIFELGISEQIRPWPWPCPWRPACCLQRLEVDVLVSCDLDPAPVWWS